MSAAPAAATGSPLLRAEKIGRKFGGFTALDDVSVDFQPGRLTSIIGPNGAGKSTFFNVLSGSFPPTSGRIVFDGQDITGSAQHLFAHRGIAKSFQITNLFPQLSVVENVRVAAQARRTTFDMWSAREALGDLTERAMALLALVGLASLGGRAGRQPGAWRPALAGDRRGARLRPAPSPPRRAHRRNEPRGGTRHDGPHP